MLKNKELKKIYFEGISKSLSNATDLFDDADILFKLKRYPRSYTLYQLTIEEVGKAAMIYDFILYKDFENKSEQQKFKKEFLSHKKKTKTSIGIDLLLAFQIPNINLKNKLIHQVYDLDKDIDKLNDLKNNSLYTNIKNGQFIVPKEEITQEIAMNIKNIAHTRLNFAKKFYDVVVENFDEIKKCSKNIDKQEMIDNPPKEILQLIKLEKGIEIFQK